MEPGSLFSEICKKMPREFRGATRAAPSREELRKLRHGRVAWLTAPKLSFWPITVAGPRPNLTAFPAALACKLWNECMTCG